MNKAEKEQSDEMDKDRNELSEWIEKVYPTAFPDVDESLKNPFIKK